MTIIKFSLDKKIKNATVTPSSKKIGSFHFTKKLLLKILQTTRNSMASLASGLFKHALLGAVSNIR